MWSKIPASLFLPSWSKNTTATQHSTAIRHRKTCWLSCVTHAHTCLTWTPYKICEKNVSNASFLCLVTYEACLMFIHVIVLCCLCVAHIIFRVLQYSYKLRVIFSLHFKGIHSYYNRAHENKWPF